MRRAQPWLTSRARVLRANETSAEDRVWQALRNRHLGGFKFVRQLPIGPYLADFACRERKVVLEIDGATHGAEAELARDAVRTDFIVRSGFRVFRAHNAEIYENHCDKGERTMTREQFEAAIKKATKLARPAGSGM